MLPYKTSQHHTPPNHTPPPTTSPPPTPLQQVSNVFAGKHGFITPRDLFRWAGRGAVGYDDLAVAGYMILGERLRNDTEKTTVVEVLNKVLRTKVCVVVVKVV